MNKSIYVVVALILVAVLAAGGYFLFVKKPAYVPSTSTNSASQEPLAPSTVPADTSTTPETVIAVTGQEYKFTPASVTVKPGEKVKVVFSNQGTMPHNWTVEGQNISTTTVEPGGITTVEFTAPAAGQYSTFCSVGSHRSQGMVGKLIVQ